MQLFNIPDMTCGHCVRTITQAVRSIDAAAQVQADLATHSIRVTSDEIIPPVSPSFASG